MTAPTLACPARIVAVVCLTTDVFQDLLTRPDSWSPAERMFVAALQDSFRSAMDVLAISHRLALEEMNQLAPAVLAGD